MINEGDTPVSEGDVVASIPAGAHVPMDIWPRIGIRRPHTGAWMMLVQELLELEAWLRTEAIPLIIMGTTEIDHLPPRLDMSRGYPEHAEKMPAPERHGLRIVGHAVRTDLPAVFRQKLPEVTRETANAFAASLSDEATVEVIERYMRVRENRGERSAVEYLRRKLTSN
jgi:hypothetical protein